MTNGEGSISNDEQDAAPEWLNAEYFEEVLNRGRSNRPVKVQSVNVKHAIPKGENYISVIYRAIVDFYDTDIKANAHQSLIVKYTPPDGATSTMLKDYNVHAKEMDVYELVIPKIRDLMRSIADQAKLYPSTLLVDRIHDAIVFEDLTQSGFRVADRVSGLDVEHSKMVLQLMAKQHASSLKLLETEPTIFDRYDTPIVTRKSDAFYSGIQSSYDAFTKEIGTWGQEWQYYSEKLQKLAPHFLEQSLTVLDHEHEDDLRVLIHGDPWTNNMMFQYDSSGKVVDLALLDLQFCSYASPAADLYYFFISSTEDEIRCNHFDELMQFYHYHLSNYATQIRCTKTIPTLYQFQCQLLKKMFYAVYSMVTILPIAVNEEPCDADLEGLTGGSEQMRRFKRIIMANEKYGKTIKGLLPILDRKGLLDELN